MPRITKQFTFEAAHILDLPYDSKCRSLHGHSYTATIQIEGPLDENGMVVDYTRIPDLISRLDHKLLVARRHDVSEPGQGFHHITVGDVRLVLPASSVYSIPNIPNTTAECIAAHLAGLFRVALKLGLDSIEVTVKETAKTSSSTGGF